MMQQYDYTGTWNSFYRYSSSTRGEDFWGQHVLQATQSGDKLRLESVPDSKSHVVLDLQLSPDGATAEGSWTEETEPSGYYKGVVYSGTITLTRSADGQRLNGTWQGKGKDGETNSDIWELTRGGVAQPNVAAAAQSEQDK